MTNDIDKNTESNPLPAKTAKIKLYFFQCLLVIVSLVAMELFSFAIIKLTTNKGPYRDQVGQVRNPYHPYIGYVHAPNFIFEISSCQISDRRDRRKLCVQGASQWVGADLDLEILLINTEFNSATHPIQAIKFLPTGLKTILGDGAGKKISCWAI